MLSNQTVCDYIRSNRLYRKTNCVGFSRQNAIDEEEGRLISCRLIIEYNNRTGLYKVSSALVYCNRYIGPRKNGKRNCNDLAFVKKFNGYLSK